MFYSIFLDNQKSNIVGLPPNEKQTVGYCISTKHAHAHCPQLLLLPQTARKASTACVSQVLAVSLSIVSFLAADHNDGYCALGEIHH